MRAKEFIIEEDLKEYKVVDYLRNMKQLKVGLKLFKKYQNEGVDEHTALLNSAGDANVSARILQSYLIDKDLIKHSAPERSISHDAGALDLTH